MRNMYFSGILNNSFHYSKDKSIKVIKNKKFIKYFYFMSKCKCKIKHTHTHTHTHTHKISRDINFLLHFNICRITRRED